MSLSVLLFSNPKRRICCCYLYLWIHAIWPSVKWWVIPAPQEELVLNLQSPAPIRPPPCPPPSTPSVSPLLLPPPPPPPLLIAHAWICWIWMEAEGMGGIERDGGRETQRERMFLWLRLRLSPVSHLRRCGTRINGIQQHGEIAAGSVCLSVRVHAAHVQQVRFRIQPPWESQSVNAHLRDWPRPFPLKRS